MNHLSGGPKEGTLPPGGTARGARGAAVHRPTPLRRRALPPRAPRSGIVLIVVLLLLLGTMILAAASFSASSLGERMAGNARDRQTAFQAAESALRDAESVMRSNTTGPFQPLQVRDFKAVCELGRCASGEGAPLWSQLSEADWTGTKTRAYGAASGAPPLAGVAAQPRTLVEYQGTAQPIEPGMPCVALFLITARASGGASTTNVILQSVFRLRVGECYAAI